MAVTKEPDNTAQRTELNNFLSNLAAAPTEQEITTVLEHYDMGREHQRDEIKAEMQRKAIGKELITRPQLNPNTLHIDDVVAHIDSITS